MAKHTGTVVAIGLGVATIAFGVLLVSSSPRSSTRRGKPVKLSRPLADPGAGPQSDDGRTYWSIFGIDTEDDKRTEIADLASAIKSEARTHRAEEQRAVAWAIRNTSVDRGIPISQIFTIGKGQGAEQPWSTALAAKEDDAAWKVASVILDSEQRYDPLAGAYSGFEPELQDKLYNQWIATGEGTHTRPATEIRDRWSARGLAHTRSIGRWEFWGPTVPRGTETEGQV